MLPVAPTTSTVMRETVMITPRYSEPRQSSCSRCGDFINDSQAVKRERTAEHDFMSGPREDRSELSAHRPPTQIANARIVLPALLRFERSHVNREAVLHIRLEHSLVGFVDLLDRDDLDISGDVVFTAEIEHFLGFR